MLSGFSCFAAFDGGRRSGASTRVPPTGKCGLSGTYVAQSGRAAVATITNNWDVVIWHRRDDAKSALKVGRDGSLVIHEPGHDGDETTSTFTATLSDGILSLSNGEVWENVHRLPHKCSKGHQLQSLISKPDEFACDRCKCQEKGVVFLGCRHCDYDICFQCAMANAVADVMSPKVRQSSKSAVTDEQFDPTDGAMSDRKERAGHDGAPGGETMPATPATAASTPKLNASRPPLALSEGRSLPTGKSPGSCVSCFADPSKRPSPSRSSPSRSAPKETVSLNVDVSPGSSVVVEVEFDRQASANRSSPSRSSPGQDSRKNASALSIDLADGPVLTDGGIDNQDAHNQLEQKVLNLMARFPTKTRAEIEEELVRVKGHAGIAFRSSSLSPQRKSPAAHSNSSPRRRGPTLQKGTAEASPVSAPSAAWSSLEEEITKPTRAKQSTSAEPSPEGARSPAPRRTPFDVMEEGGRRRGGQRISPAEALFERCPSPTRKRAPLPETEHGRQAGVGFEDLARAKQPMSAESPNDDAHSPARRRTPLRETGDWRRPGDIQKQDCGADEKVSNLLKQFPRRTREQIAQALYECDGHAGEARRVLAVT